MNKFILILALGGTLAVMTQQVFLQDDPESPGAGQGGDPVPEAAGEGVKEAQEDEQNNESGDATEQRTPNQGDELPAQAMEDGGVAEGVEDSDEIEEDFTPDEEISEDYPVPLPSDI